MLNGRCALHTVFLQSSRYPVYYLAMLVDFRRIRRVKNGGTTWTVGDVLVQRQVDREVVKRPTQQGNDPPL